MALDLAKLFDGLGWMNYFSAAFRRITVMLVCCFFGSRISAVRKGVKFFRCNTASGSKHSRTLFES